MGPRVFFYAEGITVTADRLVVRTKSFSIGEILDARCERLRVLWCWPLRIYSFALDLTLADGRRIRAARRRDAYFIFQLVNAIQAAAEQLQQAESPLAENSSA